MRRESPADAPRRPRPGRRAACRPEFRSARRTRAARAPPATRRVRRRRRSADARPPAASRARGRSWPGRRRERTSSIVKPRAPGRCRLRRRHGDRGCSAESRPARRPAAAMIASRKARAQVEFDRAPVGHALGDTSRSCSAPRSRRPPGTSPDGPRCSDAVPRCRPRRCWSVAATHSPVTALVRPHPAVTMHTPASPVHARVGVGGVGGRLLVTHVDQLDFVVAQLGEDREQMPAVDRKAISDSFSRITRATNSPPSTLAISRTSLAIFGRGLGAGMVRPPCKRAVYPIRRPKSSRISTPGLALRESLHIFGKGGNGGRVDRSLDACHVVTP